MAALLNNMISVGLELSAGAHFEGITTPTVTAEQASKIIRQWGAVLGEKIARRLVNHEDGRGVKIDLSGVVLEPASEQMFARFIHYNALIIAAIDFAGITAGQLQDQASRIFEHLGTFSVGLVLSADEHFNGETPTVSAEAAKGIIGEWGANLAEEIAEGRVSHEDCQGVKVDFFGVVLEPASAEMFGRFIHFYASSIVAVNFDGIAEGRSQDEAIMIFELLGESLTNSSHLSEANLSNLVYPRPVLRRLQQIFNKPLLELTMEDCSFDKDDMKLFQNMVKTKPVLNSLQVLHVSGITSGPDVVTKLAQVLKQFTAITDLDASRCNPDEAGSDALADVLYTYSCENPAQLVRLDLHRSAFPSGGACELLRRALRNLKGLKYVNLRYCHLPKGARGVLEDIFEGRDVELLLAEDDELDGDGIAYTADFFSTLAF